MPEALEVPVSLSLSPPICKVETVVVSNSLIVVKTELLHGKYLALSRHSVKGLLLSFKKFPPFYLDILLLGSMLKIQLVIHAKIYRCSP